MIEKLLDMSMPVELAEAAYQDISKFEKIVLWGAGEYGRVIGNYLSKKGCAPAYYCDSNVDKVGSNWNGLEVRATSDIDKDAAVVVTCNAFRDISTSLFERGFSEKQVFFFDVKWLTQPEGKREYIIDNIKKFDIVYTMLSDEKSKKVLLNLLNYRITYKKEYLAEIVDARQYFDDGLLNLKEKVVFVDAGSYIGDTLEVFIDFTNRKYEKVICLEPMEKNVSILKKYIKKADVKNVDVFKLGVADKQKTLYFDGTNGMAARESSEGDIVVECDSIDHIFEKVDCDHIDFIKMDIEGAEYEALLGAKEVIKKFHPILAICVYHKPEDYFEIPQLIKNLYDGYKLYFRHYELSDEETVCYAIAE